jgi:acetyl esterase/lipase
MISMGVRAPLSWIVVAALAVACQSSDPAAGPEDPARPGLAFGKVPAAIQLSGRFEVWARINDDTGKMTEDSSTLVTIRATGSGTLRGTLTKRAVSGRAVFDDLAYDRWEPITLTISSPALGEVSTREPLPVRPLMRFVSMPPAHVPAGSPIGRIAIELVDGRGQAVRANQPITLTNTDGVTVAGGAGRNFEAGPVQYDQITLGTPGSRTLVWQSPGLLDLIAGITVHEGEVTESLWLPAGRVGVPYRAQLPGSGEYRLLSAELPRGLTLEKTGELHGVPTVAEHARLEIFELGATTSVLWKADLPVAPEVEMAPGTLDSLDVDGPSMVTSFDEMVQVTSRRTSVPVRIFHPVDLQDHGPLPVIVFHHGALMIEPGHPRVFDRFDPLLRRWASYGFVVCAIDAPELVWLNGRLVNASLANLNAMSENQRATIDHLRVRSGQRDFALAGHLDLERIIVAGHSRGGGASLITARTEASVVGGILLEPLDPMATVGGQDVWNEPLPQKPFLLVIAGSDAELPYPMVDFLYERRSGPMVAPTLIGGIHNYTCDASCAPENGANAGITREQQQSITNAYAVAFLKYVASGDATYAPLLFEHEAGSTHLSPAGVFLRSDRGASALVVDDFQSETAGRNSLGLASSDRQMAWSGDEPSMISATRMLPGAYDMFRAIYERPEVESRSDAHRLEWMEDGATYQTTLGTLDVRRRRAFVFRARSEREPIDPGKLTLRFTDDEGATVSIPGAGHVGETGIGSRFTDVIAPLRELRAAGLNLLQLQTLEIVLQGAGAMTIDDLRFE